MEVWVLWVYLVTGQKIDAGQYQTEEWCYAGARRQRAFLLQQRPPPVRMRCEIVVMMLAATMI